MMRCAMVVVLLLAAGCSATKDIAAAANRIHANAEQVRERSMDAAAQLRSAAPDVPAAAEAMDANATDASAIMRDTDLVHRRLPGTRDVVPWWGSLLQWVAIGLVVLGVVVLLWQTGLGRAIRAAVNLIPMPVQRRAELAAATLDPDHPESARELVAAERADSPLFDKAFRRAQARLAQQLRRFVQRQAHDA